LSGCVGADEREAPRRQRRTDAGHEGDQAGAVSEHARHDQAAGGGAPVEVREQAGDEVRREHRSQRQQHMLDAVKARAEHEHGHRHRRDRHARRRRDARQPERRGDARELRARGAEIRGQQGHEQRVRPARAVALAHQRRESVTGDHAHARAGS
jgi:hypothetical protein